MSVGVEGLKSEEGLILCVLHVVAPFGNGGIWEYEVSTLHYWIIGPMLVRYGPSTSVYRLISVARLYMAIRQSSPETPCGDQGSFDTVVLQCCFRNKLL